MILLKLREFWAKLFRGGSNADEIAGLVLSLRRFEKRRSVEFIDVGIDALFLCV